MREQQRWRAPLARAHDCLLERAWLRCLLVDAVLTRVWGWDLEHL
jgi:hypothetical protein